MWSSSTFSSHTYTCIFSITVFKYVGYCSLSSFFYPKSHLPKGPESILVAILLCSLRMFTYSSHSHESHSIIFLVNLCFHYGQYQLYDFEEVTKTSVSEFLDFNWKRSNQTVYRSSFKLCHSVINFQITQNHLSQPYKTH